MNLVYVVLPVLIAHAGMFSSNQQSASTLELSPREAACFKWFEKLAKELPSTMEKLSPEDQEVYNQRLKINEHRQKVIASRNNYVDAFLKQVNDAHIPCDCDADTLKSAMIKVVTALHTRTLEKPHDELSTRLYVYNELLSNEDKDAWTRDKYLSNQSAAQDVAKRWSELLVNELAKLNLVKNTSEAKAQKAAEFYQEKINRLHKTYANEK